MNDAATGAFGGADLFACTTAGEIGRAGYEEGQIIAIAFPSALFAVDALAIDGLDALDDRQVIDQLMQRRLALNVDAPEKPYEFAFLMVDGLSLQEENVATILASAMGQMPLFGGSTGRRAPISVPRGCPTTARSAATRRCSRWCAAAARSRCSASTTCCPPPRAWW